MRRIADSYTGRSISKFSLTVKGVRGLPWKGRTSGIPFGKVFRFLAQALSCNFWIDILSTVQRGNPLFDLLMERSEFGVVGCVH